MNRKLPPVKLCQIDPWCRHPIGLRREARDILNALRQNPENPPAHHQPVPIYADQYAALRLALSAAKVQALLIPRPYYLAGPRPSPPA
jgi:hypothetical protein